MKRNNIWNRFFHRSKVNENAKQAMLYLCQISDSSRFLEMIKNCDSLTYLVSIHKTIWNLGFQNDNIGPCQYGMIRTNSIDALIPEEVYLGGIWGLSTENIPFWEKYRDIQYGDNDFGIDPEEYIYNLVLFQYKKLLTSNIKSMVYTAKQEYPKYKRYGY